MLFFMWAKCAAHISQLERKRNTQFSLHRKGGWDARIWNIVSARPLLLHTPLCIRCFCSPTATTIELIVSQAALKKFSNFMRRWPKTTKQQTFICLHKHTFSHCLCRLSSVFSYCCCSLIAGAMKSKYCRHFLGADNLDSLQMDFPTLFNVFCWTAD